jgi:iron complex outermembrane recepter protein
MRKMKTAGTLASGLMLELLLLQSSFGQTNDATPAGGLPLEEIIVTAQKRAQNIQDVPLSITALSAGQIENEGFRSFQDYGVRIPNLAFAYTSSVAALGQSIALRGVFGGETTGFYIDETPLPSSIDPQVVDLERIEVLRGPQGTLYGARSMGGTVRLITAQPDPTSFSAVLHGVTSYTEHGGSNETLDAGINLPLVDDVLAVRAFGFWDEQSGVFTRTASPDAPESFSSRDGIGASEKYGGAVSARLQLLDRALSITPRVMLQRSEGKGRPYADIRPDNFDQQRLYDLNEHLRDDWDLYSLTAQYSASFGTFTSVSSKFERDVSDAEDNSEFILSLFGAPAEVAVRVAGEFRSEVQELRFTSDFDGPLQLTVGAIYQDRDNLLVVPPTLAFDIDIFNTRIDTAVTEKAAYGEATFEVLPGLNLIAGARYFDNDVELSVAQTVFGAPEQSFNESQQEDGINPKFGVSYALTDDVNLFANAAEGFRVGGANGFDRATCAADLAALGLTVEEATGYESDSLWSYELGVKSSFQQNRLIANATAFHIDWNQVQQSIGLDCSFSITQNVGKAESDGFELELQAALTNDLSVAAAAGYTDAKITDGGSLQLIPIGQSIQQVPEWTFTTAADYDFAIGQLPFTFHADYSYVGDSVSRLNAETRSREAYDLINVRLGVQFGSVKATLFVDNVLNEIGNLADVPPLGAEIPGRPRIAASRPRTAGLDLRVRF